MNCNELNPTYEFSECCSSNLFLPLILQSTRIRSHCNTFKDNKIKYCGFWSNYWWSESGATNIFLASDDQTLPLQILWGLSPFQLYFQKVVPFYYAPFITTVLDFYTFLWLFHWFTKVNWQSTQLQYVLFYKQDNLFKCSCRVNMFLWKIFCNTQHVITEHSLY